MPQLVIIILLLAAVALQLLTGDFPVAFFAFPLNLILALLWVGLMFLLWKTRRKSFFVTYMLTSQATILAISGLLLYCLVIGLTGNMELLRTWIFVFVLFFFQTVLLFVLFRGWRHFIRHAGLLIAVSSAFWGAPDSETIGLRAVRGTPVREAYRMDGTTEWLEYEIMLEEFRAEKYENGMPMMYEADVLIDNEAVTLKVNHPYPRSFGEDVYLTGTGDGENYCVLQIVREPWKYGALVGIVLMLTGALLLFVEGPRKRGTWED